MAVSISISPPGNDPTSEIEDTARSVRTVNAIITASGDAGEVFESVTASLNINEPNIRIIPSVNSVAILGTYIDPFEDKFKYVNKGSSDKIETPTIVTGVANMPKNKEMYELQQDTRAESIKTYTVVVSSDLGNNHLLLHIKYTMNWKEYAHLLITIMNRKYYASCN